ncbi:MAG: winged helix-turn-helix domain-containing protein [Methanotrichaceae archaeon]|nr:winged helix-turn-helix domain-containing protein [Methanotrichaceae archaeon]
MKRSRPEIISEILGICRNGANKTRIVYQANLNFKTINPYLQLLVKNNLIESDQGKYKTTEKGAVLLENINQVNDQLYDNYESEPMQG